MDEITYLKGYTNYISEFLTSVDENISCGIIDNRKLIITSSQSYAILNAMSIACSTSADCISTSFIDFEEWLLWKRKISSYGEEYVPTSEEFKDYLFNSSEFSQVYNNIDYIQGCLDEIIISGINSYNAIYGMIPCGTLTADKIISVLHLFLSRLHNKISIDTYKDIFSGYIGVRTTSENIRKEIKQSQLEARLNSLFDSMFIDVTKIDVSEFREIIIFLLQLDLITITADYKTERTVDYIIRNNTMTEILQKLNISVKHPMFYFNMIKEVLKDVDNLQGKISNTIYGSALECVLKSLFSYKFDTDFLYSYSYIVGDNQGEVDLVDYKNLICYEFTISEKHNTRHLKTLDSSWDKVIISGSLKDNISGIKNIYYGTFILDLIRNVKIKYHCKMKWV